MSADESLKDKSLSELTTEIDQAVAALESNELPLEEAIQRYELGMSLLKAAQTKLNAAEQQVRLLDPAANKDEE